MSTNDTPDRESIEPRTERALTESMVVLPEGGDIYTVVATDGGVIDAGDEGEILEESDEDGRPADCGCGAWNTESDRITLPCWPCYRDGFREPNPEAPGDD